MRLVCNFVNGPEQGKHNPPQSMMQDSFSDTLAKDLICLQASWQLYFFWVQELFETAKIIWIFEKSEVIAGNVTSYEFQNSSVKPPLQKVFCIFLTNSD